MLSGTMDGLIEFEWSMLEGRAYKIPREMLSSLADIAELSHSGVYLLLGNDDTSGKPTVYVGQASKRKNEEGLRARLKGHHRKDNHPWNEAVVFTTEGDKFGFSEISFLENKLYSRAIDSASHIVINKVEPPIDSISKKQKSDLNQYIEYVHIATFMLGHKVFIRNKIQKTIAKEKSSDVTECESPQKINHETTSAEIIAAERSIRRRRPNLDFDVLGIPQGAKIQFVHRDVSAEAEVCGSRTVLFENKQTSFRAVTKNLLKQPNDCPCRPATYWNYQGKRLIDWYEDYYSEGEED